MSRASRDDRALTPNTRVVVLALTTQGLLIVAAWALARLLRLDMQWGEPVRDVALGAGGAGVLSLLNYSLLRLWPGSWLVNGVRAVYHELLVPLFARLGLVSIVLIGTAAGIGEEWLFRGVLQPLIGILPASIAFGIAHVGGRNMLPFGLWAAIMGVLLGGLANLTGGLIAPMVAHGLYDIIALQYIRRGAHDA